MFNYFILHLVKWFFVQASRNEKVSCSHTCVHSYSKMKSKDGRNCLAEKNVYLHRICLV